MGENLKKIGAVDKKDLKKWLFCLYFPAALIFMELIVRIFTCRFLGVGLILMPLLSIPIGLVLTIFCTFSKSHRVNFGIAIGITSALFLVYATQIVYFTCFGKYLVFYSITAGGAGQITQDGMFSIVLNTILSCILPIILLALPLVYLIVFGRRQIRFMKINIVQKLIGAAGSVAFHFIVLLLVLAIPAASEVYFGAFNPTQSVGYFGLATTEWMDFKSNLLNIGGKGSLSIDNSSDTPASAETEKTPAGDNVMDIDFDTLIKNETDETIKSMHQYFAAETPTKKNAYTGKFKDYNLIMLTAEGFAPYAISKELTPTLYKMQQEGFNFTNYYNSPWGVSTSDGEYVECTGLIPKSGVWSFYESGKNNIFLPFSMPQQFLNLGISPVYGYHNNTYTYYHRDVSHPNLGYLYKGLGNGLNIKNTWPQSDKEMIDVTGPEYISKDKRFHAYYMTVSGHMEYDFENNYMSYKYKDYVKDLPYSEPIKAYIACNMDLDRAMESLLKQLEEAGVADKTLIALSPDHTPYGLEGTGSTKYALFDEIFGHKVETTFEVNESVFLLYSPSMEKGVTVDKPCSPLDIIPTLNNLLGFEYDSRLLPGKDIFSDSPGLVIFENRSFITDKGRYNSTTGEFTKNEGVTIEDEDAYVSKIKTEVKNKFVISAQILETNYYAKVITDRKHIKGGLAQ